MIDKELQQYYEARFSMFITKGWTDLVEDVETMKKALSDINTVKDDKELNYRKGQLDMVNWILNLKMISEDAHRELKDEGTV